MSTQDTGGPAFPLQTDGLRRNEGMTLRQYAAIHLKVPSSGDQWLDDMIRESQRNDLAAKAMQIMWDAYDKGYCGLNNQDAPNAEIIAQGANQMADAMLEARNQ